jgi:hypothetical protein
MRTGASYEVEVLTVANRPSLAPYCTAAPGRAMGIGRLRHSAPRCDRRLRHHQGDDSSPRLLENQTKTSHAGQPPPRGPPTAPASAAGKRKPLRANSTGGLRKRNGGLAALH